MIKLHGAYGSPFVRKVLYVLAVKDLPFEHIQQMPFTGDAQYLKINPLGKIPSLQDGDLTLCDSTVICEYLEDSHPTPAVYPAGAADKARARWLEELADSRVTELAAGIFFQRYMRAIVMKKESDEELVEKIITERLPPLLDHLESQVPAEGYIFGDIMLADVSLLSPFINASYAGYQVDSGRWPLFSGLLARVKSDQVMSRILSDEAAAMGIG
jgi:glutathione S-transferase